MSQLTSISEYQDWLSRLEQVESLIDVCQRSLKEGNSVETKSVEDVLFLANHEIFNLVEEHREKLFKLEAEDFSDDEQCDSCEELQAAKRAMYERLSDEEKEKIKQANLPDWMVQEGKS